MTARKSNQSISLAIVTGGAGFLGSHLAERLIGQGVRVVVVDNFSSSYFGNEKFLAGLGKDLLVIRQDVCEPWENWTNQIPAEWQTGPTWIFHFASESSPKAFLRRNLEIMWANSVGLNRALNWADQVQGKLVFASTSEIYGESQQSPQKEDSWGHVNSYGPRSSYDESKRFGEALIYSHNLRHQTRHGLVRIFNTYGPRMNPKDGRVVLGFLSQALRGEPLTIHGTGRQTRSFSYVSDTVSGILRYMETDQVEPMNIGSPSEIQIQELARLVTNMFPGLKLQIESTPAMPDEPGHRCPDIQKALQELAPWKPAISLEEGMRLTLDWLKSQKNL